MEEKLLGEDEEEEEEIYLKGREFGIDTWPPSFFETVHSVRNKDDPTEVYENRGQRESQSIQRSIPFVMGAIFGAGGIEIFGISPPELMYAGAIGTTAHWGYAAILHYLGERGKRKAIEKGIARESDFQSSLSKHRLEELEESKQKQLKPGSLEAAVAEEEN